MTLLEAHELLARRADGGASLLPPDCAIEAAGGVNVDTAMATAAVVLSGRLEECQSDADLDEAVEHFRTLLSCAVLSTEEWAAMATIVIQEVLAWGDSETAEAAAHEPHCWN